ncbi:OmpA family protein [Robertkochia aurantiaca]|uniref:OmpA family protein n=1 Tax=Robertkochia aurantiaca TaxID=2873700 RepID=UPI001CCA7176|nr:OmpA family protein [Robertkochia sp. 3YJGBD-33]
MSRVSPYIVLLLIYFSCLGLKAQERNDFFQVGLGYNFVDDSGPGLNDYFNFEEIWHAVPYPSRLTFGYYLANGFGFEAIGSYNEYDPGKIVDGKVLNEAQTYVAIDAKLSYQLDRLTGTQGWFDPYLITGTGYTWIGDADRATFNAGAGLNIWFTRKLGLNLNSMGKWGLFTDKGTNHVQHSVGLVYRFVKDELEEVEKEEFVAIPQSQEPVPEEIQKDTVPRQVISPDEVVIAVKSKEELRREQMMRDLQSLRRVYFQFDSSYLTKGDKQIVQDLIAFLRSYPEAKIKVHAHADSRGSDKYNTWLADRRANRIVQFVIDAGIDPDRITGEGFGENKILNHCVNDVPCTEEEHRENRRTDYHLMN